ncbi:ABC transporter permease [Paraburkholderia sp. Cpub6]|uniref:MlaE family ABC transporter permease n=1 Tax=Paraburkholderia sp. Cpub6 TaxID=2723094 RepID=UPI00161A7540|nr:ABC transporter permease [Paraburkholderia sp. Cpub6]MBB5462441.1 phospholipid/cholesterol/gamma-HCH transport system permease protein [Paraburkholderia sp. Cpub6]
MPPSNSLSPGWSVESHERAAVLCLTGDWIACESGIRSAADVRHILDEVQGLELKVDASSLGQWDSALIAFLKMLRDCAGTGRTRPVQIDESGLPDAARRLLALASADVAKAATTAVVLPSLRTRIGRAYFDAWSNTVAITALVGEAALRGAAAFGGRTCTRAVDVLQLLRETGAGALGIVAIVNGLVGAIIAFVGALQLQRFGAGIYVADLVGIAVVREMAALVTAIVMAGRTGGAFAAHLATMQGNEEIDALNALGIPVFDFLVLPRIVALVTMMPLLYLYGCAVGLLGGGVVSVATLDITSATFVEELRGAVAGTQFAIGLAKSISFGALVALAGCHIGLRAGRSAAAVGHAATAAVVAGIVGVIALDAVFAVCTNTLGI